MIVEFSRPRRGLRGVRGSDKSSCRTVSTGAPACVAAGMAEFESFSGLAPSHFALSFPLTYKSLGLGGFMAASDVPRDIASIVQPPYDEDELARVLGDTARFPDASLRARAADALAVLKDPACAAQNKPAWAARLEKPGDATAEPAGGYTTAGMVDAMYAAVETCRMPAAAARYVSAAVCVCAEGAHGDGDEDEGGEEVRRGRIAEALERLATAWVGYMLWPCGSAFCSGGVGGLRYVLRSRCCAQGPAGRLRGRRRGVARGVGRGGAHALVGPARVQAVGACSLVCSVVWGCLWGDRSCAEKITRAASRASSTSARRRRSRNGL